MPLNDYAVMRFYYLREDLNRFGSGGSGLPS